MYGIQLEHFSLRLRLRLFVSCSCFAGHHLPWIVSIMQQHLQVHEEVTPASAHKEEDA